MTPKRSYANFTIFAIIIFIAYIIGNPLLPLKSQTKILLGYPKDSLLNFTELTGKYGYVTEEHTVETEDGYLLKLFRLQGQCVKKRTPVVLMHGLLQSSDVWLDAGPDAGLAYLLADACYDLWVGNTRGNYYSRRHRILNPDKDREFWKFSVDEIGYYDVPATIDYVLERTGSERVNYVGYSQGSGSSFIMCSERPGYCDKVRLLIGLAPAARQTNTRSVLYRTFALSVNRIHSVLKVIGVHELFSKGDLSQEFLEFMCQIPVMKSACDTIEALLDSNHPDSISKETTRVIFSHFPAGTSIQNIARYGQSMTSKEFEKFSYGKYKNMQVYGNDTPPAYNLSAVSAPVAIIYGKNDHLVDTKDVEWLIQKLPNVIEAVLVEDSLWNHLDVTYSQHTSRMTFPKINEYLERYSGKDH